jgi:hypothetical protein
MSKLSKFKEKMPPAKKVNKKGGKQVAGRKYAEDIEEEDYEDADSDNRPRAKPADIAQALGRAKEGYSKKKRVKPDKMKGKGR